MQFALVTDLSLAAAPAHLLDRASRVKGRQEEARHDNAAAAWNSNWTHYQAGTRVDAPRAVWYLRDRR
jgi:hypothetical protein